ncbi:MAG: HD domain-containing phosphohydrolase [Pseudohongiellaceae bacterium]
MESLPSKVAVLTLLHGPSFADQTLLRQLNGSLYDVAGIDSLAAARTLNPALVLLDEKLLATDTPADWRTAFPCAIFLCRESLDADADILLDDALPHRQSLKLLELASHRWLHLNEKADRERSEGSSVENLAKLAEIGIALSSEYDLFALLRKIITEGQNIACCDAVSLFLVDDHDDKKKQLVFKLTRNDSIDFPFQESRFALDHRSITGYVALTNKELMIPDAYRIPASVSYQFNKSFDETTGYHTKSLFAIPMTGKENQVIGVLQFINCKRSRDLKITDEASANLNTTPFDNDITVLLRALASQAGIAIESTRMHNSIKNLFEGFVNASVAAIEQRDPTTSGHSFRVADLCLGLAGAVNAIGTGVLRSQQFNDNEIQELKYAALLHDFGKVGVRESVLVKQKKLPAGTLENIRYRILLAQEKLRTRSLEQQLDLHRKNAASTGELKKISSLLSGEIKQLEDFFTAITRANEPSTTPVDNSTLLMKIEQLRLGGPDDSLSVLSDEEFEFLRIEKGSLSVAERKEIESHVVHTMYFLNHIPWTREFKNVPTIAAAHHEKLDGSGYPFGMTGKQIPVQSKIMTICDIYDALTASDRPYKTAMSNTAALDLLTAEATAGQLDTDLVETFIDAKIYKCVERKHETSAKRLSPQGYNHHPCDHDLHEH